MRPGRLLLGRRDLVEQLLCHGRLIDIQLFHFFRRQLARECRAAPPLPLSPPPVTLTTTTTMEEAIGSNAASNGMTNPVNDTVSPTLSNAVSAFQRQREAVRGLARGSAAGLTAWVGEAYGTTEWSTGRGPEARSPRARQQKSKKKEAGKEEGVITLRGRALAAGGAGTNPSTVQVIAQLVDGEGRGEVGHDDGDDPQHRPGEVVLQVPLAQEKEGKLTTKLVNGLLQLDFHDAVATLKEGVRPKDVIARQNILTATAYGGMLEKLEKVCALHVTSAVQYDGFLVRNPAIQMRLAQLACFRFGVESLAAYVADDDEISLEEAGSTKSGKTPEGLPATATSDISLFESVALNIYAENALMDGLDNVWGIVRGFPLTTARPHRSKEDVMIDYPYLDSLFNTSKYFITSINGSMELQTQEFFGPLLRKSCLYQTASAWMESPLNHLMGMTAAAKVRLAAPHVNLRVMAVALEKDIGRIIALVSRQKDLEDPSFIIAVGQYIAEVFANLAVIYRCTASLTTDEEGKGHQEWLLAQSFSAASSARRQRILSDLNTTHVAADVLRKATDLDNYCMHPVELMNAKPRGSSSC